MIIMKWGPHELEFIGFVHGLGSPWSMVVQSACTIFLFMAILVTKLLSQIDVIRLDAGIIMSDVSEMGVVSELSLRLMAHLSGRIRYRSLFDY